jgi:hypothetical protein
MQHHIMHFMLRWVGITTDIFFTRLKHDDYCVADERTASEASHATIIQIVTPLEPSSYKAVISLGKSTLHQSSIRLA